MNTPPNREYGLYESFRNNENAASAEHYVEDARSRNSRPKAPSNAKTKNKRHSKSATILLTSMITLLAFSLTLFAADLIGNGATIDMYTGIFKKKKTNYTSYYAVYATHSSDMSISYKNATVIRAEGGGGYVTKEGEEYYVILNVYDEEEKAKSIVERKSNYGLLEWKIYDFDTEKQPSLSAAESTKDIYKEAFLSLYEAANDLASGKYGKEEMKRALLSFKERIIAVENAYAERIAGSEDTCCIEYKVILAEIRSAFENIAQNDENAVADARYYSAMIIRSYSLFTQKYFA